MRWGICSVVSEMGIDKYRQVEDQICRAYPGPTENFVFIDATSSFQKNSRNQNAIGVYDDLLTMV